MTSKMTKLMIVLGAMTVAGSAMAQSATMSTSASIASECSVGNMVALGFGDIQMLTEGAPSSTASESTGGGTFDAICTNGTPGPKFKFTSANTWFNDYRLIGADGTTFLNYTLTTSGNTAITYGTPTTFGGFAANGTTQSLRIKGSIAAADKLGKLVQQYSDTITVTASFGL
jgi:spore coat protein U-like protein